MVPTAVSPACLYLLGKKVYVKGYGVYKVNVTTDWLDKKFGICTIDLATSSKNKKLLPNNTTTNVVILNE